MNNQEKNILEQMADLEESLAGEFYNSEQSFHFGQLKSIEKVANLLYTLLDKNEPEQTLESVSIIMLRLADYSTARLNELCDEDIIDSVIQRESEFKLK